MSIRLRDLDPPWAIDADIIIGDVIVHDSSRTGMAISFDCPQCVAAGVKFPVRLCVFFKNPVDGKPPSDDYDGEHLWTRVGETFDDLTLSPSVDASAHGHWHGRVVNGVCE